MLEVLMKELEPVEQEMLRRNFKSETAYNVALILFFNMKKFLVVQGVEIISISHDPVGDEECPTAVHLLIDNKWIPQMRLNALVGDYLVGLWRQSFCYWREIGDHEFQVVLEHVH